MRINDFGTVRTRGASSLLVCAVTLLLALALLSGAGAAPPGPARGEVQTLGNAITLPVRITQDILKETGPQGDQVNLPGFQAAGKPGDPALPAYEFCFLLPENISFENSRFSIENEVWEDVPGAFDVAPAPPAATRIGGNLVVEWGGKDPANIVQGRDVTVYGKDAFFPATPLGGAQISKYRPWNLAYVTLTGVAYNPVQKQLRVLRSATIRITCERGPQPQAAPASGGFAATAKTEQYWIRLRERVENPGDRAAFYPALVAPAAGGPAASAVTANYVIITTDWIKTNSTKLTSFTAHLADLGYTTSVITEFTASDDIHYLQGNTCATRAANIRNWLKSNYATVDYVLLIGDPDPGVFTAARSIPMLMCYPNYIDHTAQYSTPTDLCYAELSGSWDNDADGFPGEYGDGTVNTGNTFQDFGLGGIDKDSEVAVARIPYYGVLADLDSILQKMITYESATSGIAWRYKTLIPVAVSNTEDDTGPPFNGIPEITPRTLGGEFGKALNTLAQSYSFNTYRLYERTGCKNNGTDYPLPANFPCEAALTQANLQAEWQKNYGFVTWWGHGSQTAAARMTWANDLYSQPAPPIPPGDNLCQRGAGGEDAWFDFWRSGDCAQLNDDHPSFVFQVSCDNGYPETTNNLGYSLLKQGAITTLSASRVSWYAIGSWSTNWYASVGDNASFAYYMYDRMAGVSSQKVGDALNWCRSSFGFNWRWESWMNRLDFNLYGEPACTFQCPAEFYWKEYDGHYLSDIDQKQPGWVNPFTLQWSWCGPVAEADSILWFDQRFPYLVDDQTTSTQLAAELALLMNTDDVKLTGSGHRGTFVVDLYNGVKQYLEDHNATDTLEVHWVPDTGTDAPPPVPPTFDQITSEVLKCQDVTLLLGFWKVVQITPDAPHNQWIISWQRVGGHYVSCAGVSSETLTLAISDPYYNGAEDALTTGVIRGVNHAHPQGHNDGVSASHDYYRVNKNSISPGGSIALPGYASGATDFDGLNGDSTTVRNTTSTLTLPCPVELYDVHAEVEYAVAVSPLPDAGVNDAPTVHVPVTQKTPKDTPLFFSSARGNAIRVTDPDAALADIMTTLTVTNGTATLGSTPAGLTVTGDGTALVEMTGPQTLITSAMNRMAFTPTTGYLGPASIQVDANDLGNTGTGSPLSDSDTVLINVVPDDMFWKKWAGFHLPDFDQKQNGWKHPLALKWSFCGPVAEANSLWWFDQRFPNLVPGDPILLINELAFLMNTDNIQGIGAPYIGTRVVDLYNGIKQYLIAHQCNNVLEVHWVPNTGSDNPPPMPPSFDDITSEILKCQDVTLLLGFWRVLEVIPAGDPEHWLITWERVGGHYVSCAGVSIESLKLAISDPYWDAAEDGTTTGVMRGLNHQHPVGHNDGVSASHDIYSVNKSSISPGGSIWLTDYAPGDLTYFTQQSGVYPDIRPTVVVSSTPPVQVGQIHTEVEYAVAVSPLLPPDVTTTTLGLTTRRGGPATTGEIAKVSDDKDSSGSLLVSAAFVPAATGMLLSVSNQNGTVTALTTATASSAVGVYPAVLTVTDSDALVTTAGFTVTVLPNLVPTLGTYTDVTLAPGSSTVAHPSAPPEDGNGNIISVVVQPTTLPGGGTLSVDFTTGDVSIVTVAGTQTGDHLTTVTVTDSCGDYVEQSFTLWVGSPPTITITNSPVALSYLEEKVVNVATVSDLETAAGSLVVTVNQITPPAGLDVTLQNNAGTVAATISAAPTVSAGTYDVELKVLDGDGMSQLGTFQVILSRQPARAAAWQLFE